MTLSTKTIGLSWFREEDYPALLDIFEDSKKMPPTWKEWLKGAEKAEKGMKAQGSPTERVYIDPDTFADWCAENDCSVDSQGRHKFIAVTLASKYGNQS